jgi:DNA-binding transcriptional LysR family regulator
VTYHATCRAPTSAAPSPPSPHRTAYRIGAEDGFEAGELLDHDLIGFDRSDLIMSTARSLGFELKRGDFIVRTDSQTAMWELIKAALGIGFAQAGLVRDTPGMVPLLPGFAVPPLPVWLTTHRELFTSRRIRVIYDRLATG